MSTLLKLLGSTVFAQFLLVCISPILTRLYSPEVFGEFLVVISIVYILNAFSLGRMDMAILSIRNDLFLANAFTLGSYFSVSVSFLSFLVIFLIDIILKIDIKFYLIPLMVFSLSFYQLIISLLLRKNEINFVSKNKVAQSLMLGFGQISLGFYSGLIYSLIFAQVLSFIFTEIFNFRRYKDYFVRIEIFSNLKKYKKFIIYDTTANFFQVFSNNIFPLLIGFLLGEYVGGLYYMAYRVVITPISIFSVSVSQTIASKYSLNTNVENWRNNNENGFLLMLLIFSVPFSIFSAYAEDIIPFILGVSWIDSGTLIKCFSTWMFLRLIYDSFSINFSLINRSDVKMKIDFIILISTSILFFTLYFYDFRGLEFLEFFGYFNSIIYLLALTLFVYKLKFKLIKCYLSILISSFLIFGYPFFENLFFSFFLIGLYSCLMVYVYKIKDRILV